MKKLTLYGIAVTILIGIGSSKTQAQTNVLKLNVLSPIVKTLNVSFEHALGQEKSIQLGFAYTGASISETKLSGIQLTPEYRFYLSETSAPQGVYVAPYLRYANLSLSEDITGSKATLSSIGGGLTIGKQWIFKESITFEAFFGPSYSSTSLKVDVGTEDDFSFGIFDGFGLRLGVNLGIGF